MPIVKEACDDCEHGGHEWCPGTLVGEDGQYASCACKCGGGLEAWVEWNP